MSPDVKTHAQALKNWLLNDALPVWAKGVDQENGGFYERLNLDGTPHNINRRTRVAARQVYSFALGAKLGWSGDAGAVMTVGLDWLEGPAKRADGYLNAVLAPDKSVVKADYDFYDHAFTLFALASAYSYFKDAAYKARADGLMAMMKRDYAHPMGGFYEARPSTLPLKANPHMHLLEASLAWFEASGDVVWKDQAVMIGHLCLDHFLDKKTGALLEFFDENWAPMPGEQGRIVEPGHLFEWAWLMFRLSALTGEAAFEKAGRRLLEIGDTHGVDVGRNVGFNSMDLDFKPIDFRARLWPQTERIKAYCTLYDLEPSEHTMHKLLQAILGLRLYLETPVAGYWYDQMLEDGKMVVESAPASTLYHIICAIDELLTRTDA